jgi:cell division protein FtsW (lipid II flippase)
VVARWRLTELRLLTFPLIFLALGFALLAVVSRESAAPLSAWSTWRTAVLFGILMYALHFFLVWRWPGADQLLLPLVAGLSAIGLLMVTRLEPSFALRQTAWIGVGGLALLAPLLVLPSVDWLARYKYTWAALGGALVLVTFVLGVDPNGSGARLWLGAGGVYFQPSEIFKVLLVIFLASYLAERRELLALAGRPVGPLHLPPPPYWLPLLVVWLLSLGLLVVQRDLGAALLFFGIFIGLVYAATARLDYLLGGLGLFAVGAVVAYQAFGHVRDRVSIWLDPWPQAQDRAYQLVQGLIALAAGGILGSGLGFGYPGYIPAVHTDFVIAAIGEELGLLGTLAVLALYLLLVYRGFRIALRAPDAFHQLLAAGLSTVLGLQALIILGGTTRVMPLTGITLPFISYGGSSLLVNYGMIGLLLRISVDSRRGGPR